MTEPLTEADVRRIVRSEISDAMHLNNGASMKDVLEAVVRADAEASAAIRSVVQSIEAGIESGDGDDQGLEGVDANERSTEHPGPIFGARVDRGEQVLGDLRHDSPPVGDLDPGRSTVVEPIVGAASGVTSPGTPDALPTRDAG